MQWKALSCGGWRKVIPSFLWTKAHRFAIIPYAIKMLPPSRAGLGGMLFNMCMIVDMILAITVVTVTAGTVSELQFRIGNICTAADGAPMGVVGFFSCVISIFCSEGNGGNIALCFAGRSTMKFCSPAGGKDVLYIGAHKQKIIAQGYQREQIVGKIEYRVAHIEDGNKSQQQIKQRHDPGFDGDNKENSEFAIRVGCSKRKD